MANKNSLIKKVSEKTGYSAKDTSIIINCFLETLKESLISNGKVLISGLFTLSTYRAKGRSVRDFELKRQTYVEERTLLKCEFSDIIKNKVK